MARQWAAKLEEVKEAVKEAETSVRVLEAEKEKVEKETATEAATIEAKKREKAENDANCRLLVKSQSEKQARSEQELGELKAMIAGYEDSYRSAVVEMARVKQAIATESEALQGAEARLRRGSGRRM